MEHQFYIDRLSAFFDNELKNEELVIVKEHIDGCQECQARLVELEKLENLISSNSELSENEYWEQSAQRIESVLGNNSDTVVIPVPTKSSSLWWKLTGVAASLVLVALFAFEQKDAGDEFLKDTIVDEIKEDYNNSTPTIEEKDLKEESSEGRIEIQAEESSVSDEVGYKTKQRESSPEIKPETKQPVDNLQLKPASKPQPLKLEKELSKLETLQPDKSKAYISTGAGRTELRPIEFKNDAVETAVVESVITQDNKDKNVTHSTTASEDKVTDLKKIVNRDKKKMAQKSMAKSYKSTPSISTEIFEQTMSNDYEINYWRRKVIENNALLKKQSQKSARYSKSQTSKSSKKGKSTRNFDRSFLYKQLFEAHYNIAIKTTDSTEELESVQFLEKYANSVEKNYNSDALYYLQLYKIEKNNKRAKKNN